MKYFAAILLCIFLAVIALAVFGAWYLRRKARKFSTELFGTPDIADAARQMRVEYASTPKSVSAMTSLLLPKITADFPDFKYDEMKERANNVLTGYLRAVTERDLQLLNDGNEELRQQLENHIQMLSAKDAWEHFDQIRIHRTEISQYRKTAGRCIITFQTSLECYHYTTNLSGQMASGSKDMKYQTKYNTDLIYIQDRNLVENALDDALGVNCPNCGAPLSSLGAKVCKYCDTPIIEINIHAWSFSNVEECGA